MEALERLRAFIDADPELHFETMDYSVSAESADLMRMHGLNTSIMTASVKVRVLPVRRSAVERLKEALVVR